MKRLQFVYSLLIFAFPLFGQQYRISFQVNDSVSHQPIESAIIMLTETNTTGFTDSLGIYTTFSRRKLNTIRIQHLNYFAIEKKIVISSDTILKITLKPLSKMMSEVVVSHISPTKGSEIQYSQDALLSKGMVSGESNIYSLLQKSPGVAHSGEIAAGLYMRGMSEGNTGICFNNINLLGLSHLLSIYPVFNSDAIDKLTFSKDNCLPELNGSLAGYLFVSTERDIQNKFSGMVELGLLSSKMGLKIPLIKDKISLTANLRRSYFDLVSDKFGTKSSSGKAALPDYRFWDTDISIQANSGATGKLLFSFFHSNDKFLMENEKFNIASDWQNSLGAINWRLPISKEIQIEVDAGVSNYFTNVEFTNLESRQLANENTSVQAAAKIKGSISKKLGFEVGSKFQHYTLLTKTSLGYSTDSVSDKLESNSRLFSEYFQLTYAPAAFVKFNGALRFEQFGPDYNVNSISPLFSAHLFIGQSSVLLSWSKQTQYQHLYLPLGMNIPMKIWYPSTIGSPFERAYSTNISLNKYINRNWSLYAGLYYINLNNQIEILEGNTVNPSEAQTDVGRGYSAGAEFTLKAARPQYTSELSYSFGKSERKFFNINNGEPFSSPYDIPHKIDFSFIWNFENNWSINISQFYQSGLVITLPTGIYLQQEADNLKSDPHVVPIYDKRYNFRMPANHRMDISVRKAYKKAHYSTIFSLGIYNVYAFANPYFVYFKPKRDEESQKVYLEAKKKSLLPLLPFFNIKFEFR
jgi:hypothetical protein